MEKKKVEFTTHGGAPLVIDVTGADGHAYQMQVTLAVFAVFDPGTRAPAPPPNDGETVPQFEVQVQVASLVRPKRE